MYYRLYIQAGQTNSSLYRLEFMLYNRFLWFVFPFLMGRNLFRAEEPSQPRRKRRSDNELISHGLIIIYSRQRISSHIFFSKFSSCSIRLIYATLWTRRRRRRYFQPVRKKKKIIREKKENGSSYLKCFAIKWKRNSKRKNWANRKRKTRHTEEDYLEHNMSNCVHILKWKRDPG
jgi:hypothetical protein